MAGFSNSLANAIINTTLRGQPLTLSVRKHTMRHS